MAKAARTARIAPKPQRFIFYSASLRAIVADEHSIDHRIQPNAPSRQYDSQDHAGRVCQPIANHDNFGQQSRKEFLQVTKGFVTELPKFLLAFSPSFGKIVTYVSTLQILHTGMPIPEAASLLSNGNAPRGALMAVATNAANKPGRN